MAENRKTSDKENSYSKRVKKSKISIMSSDKKKPKVETIKGEKVDVIDKMNEKTNINVIKESVEKSVEESVEKSVEESVEKSVEESVGKTVEDRSDEKHYDHTIEKYNEESDENLPKKIKMEDFEIVDSEEKDNELLGILENFIENSKDPEYLENFLKDFKGRPEISGYSFKNKFQTDWISAREMDRKTKNENDDIGIQIRDIQSNGTRDKDEKDKNQCKEGNKVKFNEIEIQEINMNDVGSDCSSCGSSDAMCICDDSYSDGDITENLFDDSDEKSIDDEISISGEDEVYFQTSNTVVRKMSEKDVENILILDNIGFIDRVQDLVEKNFCNFMVCCLDDCVLSFFGAVDYDQNLEFFDEKLKNVVGLLRSGVKSDFQRSQKNKHLRKIDGFQKPESRSNINDRGEFNDRFKIIVYNRIVNSFNPRVIEIDEYRGCFIVVSEILTGIKDTKHIYDAFPEYGKNVTSEPPKFIENIHLNKNYISKKRVTIRNRSYDVFLLDGGMMKQFISAVNADCD